MEFCFDLYLPVFFETAHIKHFSWPSRHLKVDNFITKWALLPSSLLVYNKTQQLYERWDQ